MPGAVFSSSSMEHQFSNILIVGWPSSNDTQGIEFHRQRLAPYFETITFAQQATPSDTELAEAEVIYGLPRGNALKSVSQVPKLKLIQLASAGGDRIVDSALWEDEKAREIKLTSASGVHTGPIPQVLAFRLRTWRRNSLFRSISLQLHWHCSTDCNRRSS
jgi:phosphoglycerate dehydrogenase-like enzyme